MAPLRPDEISPDPLRALCAWIDEARATGQPQPLAMTLATAGQDGRPSARMVFVRRWGPAGLEWITDGRSRKAREIAARADAAGVFFWAGLGRQARVEGPVHLLPDDEVAAHIARAPTDNLSILKEVSNTWFENMGMEPSVRRGADLDAIYHQFDSFRDFFRTLRKDGVKAAFRQRRDRYG